MGAACSTDLGRVLGGCRSVRQLGSSVGGEDCDDGVTVRDNEDEPLRMSHWRSRSAT